MGTPSGIVPQRKKEQSNEPFSEAITYDLALPVSHHLGAEAPLQDPLRTGVAEEVGRCIRAFAEQTHCEVVELNVQLDHVHLLVMVPPKVSVSDFVGMVKGRTAIRVFNKFGEASASLNSAG